MLTNILAIILLPVVFIVPAVYYLFELKRPTYAGPWPDESVKDILNERVQRKYVYATTACTGMGLFLGSFGALNLCFADFVIAGLIGLPLGSFWSRYVIRNAKIRHSGPDPSIPDEKLFPSDHVMRRWYEGQVNPSPLWKDMLFLAACEIIGALIGLSFILLWRKL